MRTQDHPERYLKEAYLGEIGGEETFKVLVEALPERREALELLAEVERATAEFLLPNVTAEVTQAEIDRAREQARARTEDFAVDSWQDLIDASLPIVEQALETFKQAHALAPSELLTVYETYTAHEQALVDYLRMERDGKNGGHALKSYLARL